MILNFSTVIKGKETFFKEKIWAGFQIANIFNVYSDLLLEYELKPADVLGRAGKFHTIRDDKDHRWRIGMMIDFYINARQKDMFRFAPQLPCTTVQEFEIKDGLVYVDEKELPLYQVKLLAINDGFESIADFYTFFGENYKGRIIHWTEMRY